MSVKGIFKILIGTTVVMVLISLFGEYINISTNSAILKGTIIRCINKACDYYVQETYKDGAMGNIVGNLRDLTGKGGTLNGSGIIFMGSSATSVYNNLYKNSTEFDRFMQDHKGEWLNLDRLYYGLNGAPLAGGYTLTNDDKELGVEYASALYTPINLGIAYLDRETVERIAKYNIIMTLSNGNSDNIYNNLATSHYVQFKGFRVYYNDIRINSITYKVYHMNLPYEQQEFKELTGIDVNQLEFSSEDSKNICVAFINYIIPISYHGVTPLKSIISYVWNTRVEGLDGSAPVLGPGGSFNETNLDSLTQDTTSAGTPINGEIIYYIID